PLKQARKEAADKAGRSGFMEIAATHPALLMAQGAGRLLRSVDDRGVVAVLDSRLATARYGSFIRASMPRFWETSDLNVASVELRRLNAQPVKSRSGGQSEIGIKFALSRLIWCQLRFLLSVGKQK